MSRHPAFASALKPAFASSTLVARASTNVCKHLTKAALAVALATAISPAVMAMESLTYKGTLSEHDKPANGSYEMQLQFFTEEFGGSQLGFAITLPNVQVKDGSFQVPIDLPAKLPEQQSVWLQAQIKPAGASGFFPLDGRQEIKSTTGGTCWETTGNTGISGGTVGITGGAPGNLLALTSSGSTLFLRAGGGVEQNAAFATGLQSVALQNSRAAGLSSFTAGKGATSAGHSFSMVFADGQGVAESFGSTAANQFLVRAQNGVGINTNTPRGSLSVQRGGVSGAGAVSPSAITAESDTNMYITLLTPSTQERGILFGDQTNTAMGGIIFDTLSPANNNGMSFRAGGNIERMRITSEGHLHVGQYNSTNQEATLFIKPAAGDPDGDSASIRLVNPSDPTNVGTWLRNGFGGEFSVFLRPDGTRMMNVVGRLYVSEDVGIGRLVTANKLEVQGSASKTTAGDWLANSDRRIKADIAPIEGALTLINQVEPVTFRYSDAYRAANKVIGNQRYYNVIAQDFAKVFPDAVKGSGEYLPGAAKTKANEILQVDTYPATITAIAAIQELDVKSSFQDERVAKLEAENADLRARLASIEARLGVSAAARR